jgi:hypothetical protein
MEIIVKKTVKILLMYMQIIDVSKVAQKTIHFIEKKMAKNIV